MTRFSILAAGFLVTATAYVARDARRTDLAWSTVGQRNASIESPNAHVATGFDSLMADTLWARLTVFGTRAVTIAKLGEPQRREMRSFPTKHSLQRRRIFDPDVQAGDSLITWTYAMGTALTFRVRKGNESLVEARARPDFPPIADLGKRFGEFPFDDYPIHIPPGFDWGRVGDTLEYSHLHAPDGDQTVNLYVVRDTLRLLGIKAGQCGPVYC